MGKNQHVVPHNGRWGIKGEGNTKLTSTFNTQAEAIAKAREISRNQQSETCWRLYLTNHVSERRCKKWERISM